MAFKPLENYNTFLLPTVAFAALLVLQWLYHRLTYDARGAALPARHFWFPYLPVSHAGLNKPAAGESPLLAAARSCCTLLHRRRRALWALFAFSLIGFAAFESYFRVGQCAVSDRYFEENIT
jgi:hypothetical protein